MMSSHVVVSVYVGTVFLAGASPAEALSWGAVVGIVAGLALAVLRWRVPARAAPRESDDAAADEAAEARGWDFSSVVMAAIVIPIVMIIAVTVDQVTAVPVMAAIACSIAASASAELAVVHPLYKRWDIAPD